MALEQTATATQQYAAGATSPSTVSVTVQPVVVNGTLAIDPRFIQPGVFSPGTPREGTASNPQNDSNS